MARKRAASLKEDDQEGQEDRKRRPFNTRLNAEIVLEAQIRCLREGVFMNHIIEELLAAWLGDKVKVAGKNGNKGSSGKVEETL